MKKGTKVKISRDSEFFDREGEHGIGKIIKNDKSHLCQYHVRFEDGYLNSYNEEDLIIMSWRDRFNTTNK